GHNRSINRHQWDLDSLNSVLDEPSSIHARIFKGILRVISIRRRQPAFHPNATQFTLHLGDQIFAFWRQSIRRDQSIFCLNNLSDDFVEIQLREINLISTDVWVDLILDKPVEDTNGTLELCPYQSVWLTNERF
ncbi:MAG TPA: alpha-amylase, partial [Verrucomicrobiales bacterium]|nr:alpha-amylase [Verrucomicrobiales bacterium]